jgi:hypothetical protein
MFFRRPPLALVLGARGAGKSFLSALDTHLASRWHPRHGTRILGGSKAQSEQVYRALCEAVWEGSGPVGSDAHAIDRLLKTQAIYKNGSEVSILAASATSVRGPHVPSLKLDEVDEIPPPLREAAMGMCMDRNGASASVLMTSTWHRVGGPMAELIDRGRSGDFRSTASARSTCWSAAPSPDPGRTWSGALSAPCSPIATEPRTGAPPWPSGPTATTRSMP